MVPLWFQVEIFLYLTSYKLNCKIIPCKIITERLTTNIDIKLGERILIKCTQETNVWMKSHIMTVHLQTRCLCLKKVNLLTMNGSTVQIYISEWIKVSRLIDCDHIRRSPPWTKKLYLYCESNGSIWRTLQVLCYVVFVYVCVCDFF